MKAVLRDPKHKKKCMLQTQGKASEAKIKKTNASPPSKKKKKTNIFLPFAHKEYN